MLPEPECRGGYTSHQVASITTNREEEFWAWMAGQTMMICGGPDDGAGGHNCEVAHGMPIVYRWDLERFLEGRSIID